MDMSKLFTVATVAVLLSACSSTANRSVSPSVRQPDTRPVVPLSGKVAPRIQPVKSPAKLLVLSEIPDNHPVSTLVVKGLTTGDGEEFTVQDKQGNAVTNLSQLKGGEKMIGKSNGAFVAELTVETITDGTYQATAIKTDGGGQQEIFVPLAFPDSTQSGGYYKVKIVDASGLSGLRASYETTNELALKDLPKIGTVQYKGLAIGFTKDRVGKHKEYGFDIGSITLEVSFSGNSSSGITRGKITRQDKTEITLEETPITDIGGKAKYSGTNKAKATVGGQPKTGSYEGKFLGKDAAYTVGKVGFTGDVQFLNTAFGAGRTK